MNLHAFVMTLQPHVFRVLLSACVERLDNQVRDIPVLTDAERALATENRVKAIKCFKDRTGLGLKESVDIINHEIPKPELKSNYR